MSLGDAFVTKVSLGSPLLIDQDELVYKSIDIRRTDDQGSAALSWDVSTGKVL